MPIRCVLGVVALSVVIAACSGDNQASAPAPEVATASPQPAAEQLPAKARRLARQFIIADGHVDTPYRLTESRAEDGSVTEDVSTRTERGDFDYPRARAGGLDAPFMSIYIPAKNQQTPGSSKKLADELIDMVEELVKSAPDKFALAHSPAAVERNFRDGKLSLPMGIENGAAIEDDLANLAHFHARGIRYITLTHSRDNLICDSSYDEAHTNKGLTPFGRQVIGEMNRLGIMVDVSHISDDSFWQVMELAQAPVIASHSSLRHFTPEFERNLTDDMVKKVADGGGVVLVNFGSTFVNDAARKIATPKWKAGEAYAKEHGYKSGSPEMRAWSEAYNKQHPPIFATVGEVVDHLERVVTIAGVDHVGFGSDFDGVGDTLPTGLKDVSMYPALIQELLRRGYTEEQVGKICGGNLLRVWRAVQAHAATHN